MKIKLLLLFSFLTTAFLPAPAARAEDHHRRHQRSRVVARHSDRHDHYRYERRLHAGRYRYYRDGHYYYRYRDGSDWGYRPYRRDPVSLSVGF